MKLATLVYQQKMSLPFLIQFFNMVEILGHCKGGNFNDSYLGVVRLFHLLKKRNKVIFTFII